VPAWLRDVCLVTLQVVQQKPLEAYRNTFANLALPLFAMAEPIPAKSFSHNDLKWSIWDRWILEGDFTVQVGAGSVLHSSATCKWPVHTASLDPSCPVLLRLLRNCSCSTLLAAVLVTATCSQQPLPTGRSRARHEQFTQNIDVAIATVLRCTYSQRKQGHLFHSAWGWNA
jgi:hypothetical protein